MTGIRSETSPVKDERTDLPSLTGLAPFSDRNPNAEALGYSQNIIPIFAAHSQVFLDNVPPNVWNAIVNFYKTSPDGWIAVANFYNPPPDF